MKTGGSADDRRRNVASEVQGASRNQSPCAVRRQVTKAAFPPLGNGRILDMQCRRPGATVAENLDRSRKRDSWGKQHHTSAIEAYFKSHVKHSSTKIIKNAFVATIGERVKHRRLEDGVGVSVKEIAKAAGISESAVYQLERGEGGLKPENLIAIAKRLGVTPEWLATGEGLKENITDDERSMIIEYRKVSQSHRVAVRRFLRFAPDQQDMFIKNVLIETFKDPVPDAIVGQTIQPAPSAVHQERRRYSDTNITWPAQFGRRSSDKK